MARRKPAALAPGRYAYKGLDRALHEKARLGIMTSLVARGEGVSFAELKELCSLTDGNLNRHLAVLEEERFIELRKTHEGHRPRTECRLTSMGRRRFEEYIAALEQVVADAAAAGRGLSPATRTGAAGYSPA